MTKEELKLVKAGDWVQCQTAKGYLTNQELVTYAHDGFITENIWGKTSLFNADGMCGTFEGWHIEKVVLPKNVILSLGGGIKGTIKRSYGIEYLDLESFVSFYDHDSRLIANIAIRCLDKRIQSVVNLLLEQIYQGHSWSTDSSNVWDDI